MEIKLPRMPFKFDSPEGRMEVTVRDVSTPGHGPSSLPYAAGLSFLQSGPRAVLRIPLSVKSASHTGAMRALVEGFTVNLGAHRPESLEFRVLTALCKATGVVEVN